jgi:hypothetical protein
MWLEELISLLKRLSEIVKKIDPMITCSPWNPVAMKNVEPKEESAIQKGASLYSNPWKKEKITPNVIVKVKANFALLKFLFSISWWDQVIETPEERSKIVFKRGILIGLKEVIERGGHDCPSSMVGEILLWKKAQKKDTKKNTSDVIKRIMPVFNPFITTKEWLPWSEASRWMSRHHENEIRSIKDKEAIIVRVLTLFISNNPEITKHKAPLDANKGHGLWSTKWKGLNFFIII